MSKIYSALKKKIDSKKAKICIVGLGYVGLPIALEFAKKGFSVYGYDTKKSRMDGLKKGKSHIDDIKDKDIKKLVGIRFHPTHKIEVLNILLSLTDRKIKIMKDPARFRPNDIPVLIGDSSKLRKITGWRPEISLKETLKDLLEYWRNNV